MARITTFPNRHRPPLGENGVLPPLEAGDRLDQRTFHLRYEAMPENVRAELVGGVVFMPSPLKPRHGQTTAKVIYWLGSYEEATPGVELYDNTTSVLGPDSEPQPDALLIVSPTKGGQMHMNKEGYLEGSPELIIEIASSTESIDLHAKKSDYEQAGAREYLVVALRQAKVFWFILRQGKYEEIGRNADGFLCSQAFPGLWLDPGALLRGDSTRLLEVLRKGLATPEHSGWKTRLSGMKKSSKKPRRKQGKK